MNNLRTSTQEGLSVIELLIVLVILGVLTTLAVLGFSGAKVDLERQAVAREFKVYLERARFDSVKRRAAIPANQANLRFTSPSSFTAQIDFDADGVLSPAEVRVVDFSQRSKIQIVVSDAGLSYPITLRFDQRGQVTATDSLGGAVNPVFTICSGSNCSLSSPNTTVIALSATGTVAILKNGQTPSAAPTPVISNTSPTLNCYVLITNANTTCSL